jgi:hypothetical protein
MRLEHWLNAIALVIGFVSALLMFFWTPKLEEFHADGSPIHRLALESQPTRWGKVRVAVDPWLRLAGPLLLAIASCCSSRP